MTEKKTFEVGKTYTWYKDAPNPFKVVAVDPVDGDSSFICVYTKSRSSPFRVYLNHFEHHVEYKEPLTEVKYFNLHPSGLVSGPYLCREVADRFVGIGQLACKKVVITEGEFDV